jgi:hypothetical protein
VIWSESAEGVKLQDVKYGRGKLDWYEFVEFELAVQEAPPSFTMFM